MEKSTAQTEQVSISGSVLSFLRTNPKDVPQDTIFIKQCARQQTYVGAWSSVLFWAMMETEEGRNLFRQGVKP